MEKKEKKQLKTFTIRDVETVKTTAAMYPIFLCGIPA